MRNLSDSRHSLVKSTWLQLCMLAMLVFILKILHIGFQLEEPWSFILISLGVIWLIGYEVARVLLLAVTYYSDESDNKFCCIWRSLQIRILMLAVLALILYLVHSCLNPVEVKHFIGLALSVVLTIGYIVANIIMTSKIFTSD